MPGNMTQSLLFRERITTLGEYSVIVVIGHAPIQNIIWYDFGFGTGGTKSESKRLHHKNGSAILRKCPLLAGDSVDRAQFEKTVRQPVLNVKSGNQAGGTRCIIFIGRTIDSRPSP